MNMELESYLKSNDLTFVLFHSRTCDDCLSVEKYIYEIGKQGTPISLVNTKENKDICKKYSVVETPTVVVFAKNKVRAHLPGVLPESKYKSFVIRSENL